MNKAQLRRKLMSVGVPSNAYSLEGGLPSEAYCLNRNGAAWEVYYSERGEKTGLRTFDNESEACEYLYRTMVQTLRDMGLL